MHCHESIGIPLILKVAVAHDINICRTGLDRLLRKLSNTPFGITKTRGVNKVHLLASHYTCSTPQDGNIQ